MNEIDYAENLGKSFECKVSGFVGVCTSVVQYLNGNPRMMLMAKATSGESPGELWAECSQLKRHEE